MQAGRVHRGPPAVSTRRGAKAKRRSPKISTNAPFPGMVMSVDARITASLLARVEPFDGLDEGTRLAVASRAGHRIVERGQVICWQDEPGDSMFVLVEGVVKVVVRSRDGELMELVRHHPPASFGELAVLDGGPRSATVEAVERSVLLVVTRGELLRLLRAEEQVAEALLRSLGTMVRRTTNQVADLAFLSLQGRVAAKLLDLAGAAGQGAARTRRVTQVELATMVGGARQSVNQALKALEARGYIRAAGRAFEILAPEQLRRLAGDRPPVTASRNPEAGGSTR
jgi:CRP/FNR family cyclic AMP-dependent transcriptional regulator